MRHSAKPLNETADWLRRPLVLMAQWRCMRPVRPEGANHQWRRNPPGELSIDPVADEPLVPMSGDGKRSLAAWPKLPPILDFTGRVLPGMPANFC